MVICFYDHYPPYLGLFCSLYSSFLFFVVVLIPFISLFRQFYLVPWLFHPLKSPCPPLISDTLCVSLAPSEINAYILLLSLASILLSVLRLLQAISLQVWLYCCCYLLSSSSSVAYPLRLPILFDCLSSFLSSLLVIFPAYAVCSDLGASSSSGRCSCLVSDVAVVSAVACYWPDLCWRCNFLFAALSFLISTSPNTVYLSVLWLCHPLKSLCLHSLLYLVPSVPRHPLKSAPLRLCASFQFFFFWFHESFSFSFLFYFFSFNILSSN